MFSSNTSQVDGGYQISRSLRFNSADSAYLNRTPASAGNRTTWTWSMWIKRSLNDAAASEIFTTSTGEIYFNSNNTLGWYDNSTTYLTTTQVFRDPSSWYHLVFVWDTTSATSSNRVRIYVNGVQITAFTTETYPAQNTTSTFNLGVAHNIGRYTGGTLPINAYMTEINFIDGQALTPSSFGETNAQTGVWQPKAYSGSYGTNGFYLNFSDNSNTTAATLGKDYSGNGNNWTPNNFSVSAGAGNDSLVDVPTNWGSDGGIGGEVRGNYCTLNPLDKGADITAVNGNLDVSITTGAWRGMRATVGMQSGKWYWEYTPASGTYHIVSISQPQASTSGYIVNNATAWGYQYDGTKITNDTASSYGSGWGAGDVVGIAFDADAGTLTFYKNGVSQGTAFTGLTSGPYIPGIGVYPTATGTFNFGQRPFAYTAPSGYKALCTQNLPTPTIGATTATQANKYFDVVLRTSNGSAGGTYSTTVNMSNGALLWDKARSINSAHYLLDSVRGISKTLSSNTTGAEASYPNWFTNFGTSSFTTGPDDYTAGTTVVDWIWAANGSGSSNTAGSITSTVSANTTSGFSIATWTGNSANATIGHGLGVAPRMVIIKYRGTTDAWYVYHTSTGAGQYLVLNNTDAAAANTNIWQNTAPTSSVFSIGFTNNQSTIVAYCFAEVPGFSAFGSYTGNGSNDGPFVFCGFRPRLVMAKNASNLGSWVVLDTAQDPYNIASQTLNWNSAGAVSPFNSLDIVSNGFKMRNTNSGFNTNGDTYIFVAFAENPFKYSLAR